MKACLLFMLFCLPLCLIGQIVSTDSLMKALDVMKEDTTKVNSYILLSNKYRTAQIDYVKAQKYASLSIQLSEKINFPKGLFKGTIALAYATRDMGKYPEGIEGLKKAIAIFEGNKVLQSDASLFITHVYTYTALADLYTYLPDYANAQKYAFKALELSEQYKKGVGQCWMALSIIFSKQKNLVEANKYALMAKTYFEANQSTDDLARAYAFLARYAFTAADYPQAISYYQMSYNTYKQANSIAGQRIALYNLAEIYLKTKDYDKADDYVNQTLDISKGANDVIYQFFINQLKFNINFDRKYYTEALVVADLMLQLARNEKNLENVSQVYQKYLSVYLALGDTAKAFVTLEKIATLKDSTYNTEIAKHSADLLKKYESEKKEQQIAFLDKENKFKSDKLFQEQLLNESLQRENDLKDIEINQSLLLKEGLERENTLRKSELDNEVVLNKALNSKNAFMIANSKMERMARWFMLIGLAVLVIFGISYYRNYRNQKAANAKISKQADDLKVLMKEVHHRVKNNLQVIVAMLRMQARTLQDQLAIDALNTCENRLQSIAIVHEKLYQSQNISDVVLKEYLQDIVQVLAPQYLHSFPKLSYQVTDETKLSTNIETAIPLGMIVNELVTNAFKYAFHQVAAPHIRIQITSTAPNTFQLVVADNGAGLPNGQLPNHYQSLGLKLVQLFTEQIGGTLAYATNNGACFTITFPFSATAL
jgi:two-component sensor histidine kinase